MHVTEYRKIIVLFSRGSVETIAGGRFDLRLDGPYSTPWNENDLRELHAALDRVLWQTEQQQDVSLLQNPRSLT